MRLRYRTFDSADTLDAQQLHHGAVQKKLVGSSTTCAAHGVPGGLISCLHRRLPKEGSFLRSSTVPRALIHHELDRAAESRGTLINLLCRHQSLLASVVHDS